ncbi:unnamed protein product, partial [Brachionus calyciflorus]
MTREGAVGKIGDSLVVGENKKGGEDTGEKHVVEAKGDNVLKTNINARSQAQGPRPKVGRLPKAQSEAAMKQNVNQTKPEHSTELR